MPRIITHETYVKENTEKFPNIIPISDYRGMRERITLKCKICGNVWDQFALSDWACRRCTPKKSSSTHDEFIAGFTKKHPDVSVMSQYTHHTKPITLHCDKCGYEWTRIATKASGCPNCKPKGQKPRETHEAYLDKLKENNIVNIIPLDQYEKAHTRILHKSLSCGHEFMMSPSCVLMGQNCPVCHSMVLQVGVNDMWTTNPGLASLLADPEDGFKYMQSSNVKLDWICHQCGMLIKDRSPNLFQKQGLFCPICSDGISTPNKFVTSVLHHLGVDFKPEKMFSWNPKKIYDFYVQEPDCLIEVHGLQHYEDYRFSRRKPRGLKEEQENDKQKQECALANGIQHYIIIDARYTELEWMRNSILKSELSTLFDLGEVNWDSCYKDACHSKLIEACELYQSGYSLEEIIGKLHRSRSSIIRYIKSGSNIGLCKPYKNRNFKKVICLNTSEVFDNIKAAQRAYGTSEHISNCCAGVRRYCGTHPMTGEKLKWMYLQDYNKRHESTQPGAFI